PLRQPGWPPPPQTHTRGGRTFSTGANFFERISESKFQIITEVVSALFARVGREVLLVTRLEQRYSWSRCPSERPGEGVRDLITTEPEQSGSFFYWLLTSRSVRPGQRSPSEPEACVRRRRGGHLAGHKSQASRPAEQAPQIVRLSVDRRKTLVFLRAPKCRSQDGRRHAEHKQVGSVPGGYG